MMGMYCRIAFFLPNPTLRLTPLIECPLTCLGPLPNPCCNYVVPWKSSTPQDTSGTQSSTNKSGTSNSVGARVALWTKRLEEERSPVPPLDGAQSVRRRTRATRFKTQPVTMEEVAHAHALNSQVIRTHSGSLEEQEIGTNRLPPPIPRWTERWLVFRHQCISMK